MTHFGPKMTHFWPLQKLKILTKSSYYGKFLIKTWKWSKSSLNQIFEHFPSLVQKLAVIWRFSQNLQFLALTRTPPKLAKNPHFDQISKMAKISIFDQSRSKMDITGKNFPFWKIFPVIPIFDSAMIKLPKWPNFVQDPKNRSWVSSPESFLTNAQIWDLKPDFSDLKNQIDFSDLKNRVSGLKSATIFDIFAKMAQTWDLRPGLPPFKKGVQNVPFWTRSWDLN